MMMMMMIIIIITMIMIIIIIKIITVPLVILKWFWQCFHAVSNLLVLFFISCK